MATTSSVSGLAAHLRLAIARSNRRLRQEAGSGLSPTLTAALHTVELHGPLTPSELAARERVQRPTATRVVARLAEEGLVARTPDPEDRRSALVAVTPRGRRLLDLGRTHKDVFLARRRERLGPEARATLGRASEILGGLLEDEEGGA